MAHVFDHIPWQILSGASVSQALDIEANGSIVGIIVATGGTWTAAKIAFTAYVPETGTANEGWSSSGATYATVLNDVGVAVAYGDGASIILQWIFIGATAASPRQIDGLRYVKVNSGTVAGAVITGVNQGGTRNGYLIIRRDH